MAERVCILPFVAGQKEFVGYSMSPELFQEIEDLKEEIKKLEELEN